MKYTVSILLIAFSAVALAKDEPKKAESPKHVDKKEPHKGEEKAEFVYFGQKPKHHNPLGGGFGHQPGQANNFPGFGQGFGQGQGQGQGFGQGQGQGFGQGFGQGQGGQWQSQGQFGQPWANNNNNNNNNGWGHHPDTNNNNNGFNGQGSNGLNQGWNPNQQGLPGQQQGYPFQQPGNSNPWTDGIAENGELPHTNNNPWTDGIAENGELPHKLSPNGQQPFGQNPNGIQGNQNGGLFGQGQLGQPQAFGAGRR